MARRIFLRLIAFNGGRPHTRRQQALTALQVLDEDAVLFTGTLAALTDHHRLLTTSGEGQDLIRSLRARLDDSDSVARQRECFDRRSRAPVIPEMGARRQLNTGIVRRVVEIKKQPALIGLT